MLIWKMFLLRKQQLLYKKSKQLLLFLYEYKFFAFQHLQLSEHRTIIKTKQIYTYSKNQQSYREILESKNQEDTFIV